MSQIHTGVIRRLLAGPVNSGRFEELDTLFAPGALFRSVYRPEPFVGPGGVREFFAMFRTGYPDLNVTIEHLLSDGDYVAARLTVRGTNTGPMRGNPPSGMRVEFGEMFFFRFENGRIAEVWQQVNVLDVLRQCGKLPTEQELKRLQKVMPVLKRIGKVIDFFSGLGRTSSSRPSGLNPGTETAS